MPPRVGQLVRHVRHRVAALDQARLDPHSLPPPMPRDEWVAIMRQVGEKARSIRVLLGLSQDTLGRVAGVSQGAVSRLESKHAAQTPLLTVVKVFAALGRQLSAGHVETAPEMGVFIETLGQLVPPMREGAPVTANPQVAALLTAFGSIPVSKQDKFIELVVPIAAFMRED